METLSKDHYQNIVKFLSMKDFLNLKTAMSRHTQNILSELVYEVGWFRHFWTKKFTCREEAWDFFKQEARLHPQWETTLYRNKTLLQRHSPSSQRFVYPPWLRVRAP